MPFNVSGPPWVVSLDSWQTAAQALVSEAGIVLRSTGYDQTAELQQAANDLFASKGGTSSQGTTSYNTGFYIRLVDKQEYAISSVTMPPGMALVSGSGLMVPFSDKPNAISGATPVSNGAILRHITQTAPMLQNDTTRAVIRTGAQGFGMNTIQGLTMVSDRFISPGRGDSPFIFWRSSFGLNLIGNLALTSSGFGLKMVSCNACLIYGNWFVYAPWFLQNIIDSQIAFNQVGGGNGYASDAVWLTGDVDNDQVTRLNVFQSNLFYNNNSNGNFTSQYAEEAGITGISGDTITLNRNVDGGGDQKCKWRGETPLTFSTIGTLPTATGHTMRANKTYWATVQAGGTTIKLSKNRADRAAGTYLSFSAAGSGNSLRVGGNANLHCNDGTSDNQFLPLRADQSFGDAILMNGAPNNAFAAVQVSFARSGNAGAVGYVVPTAGPAITLKNGSTGNQFKSGIINGLQHTDVGVGPSAQKFAFSVDASSRPGLEIGVKCINHTPANSVAGAQAFEDPQINPRRIVLVPEDFVQSAATAVVGISLVARNTLSMTNGAGAASSVRIPTDWSAIRARILWANDTVTAGAVNWSMRLGYYDLGSDISATEQSLVAAANASVVAGDIRLLKESTIEFGASDNFIGKVCAVRLIRTDGSGPTIQVVQVIFEESV